MSLAIGGTLGLGGEALGPPSVNYWRALGMSGGAILNLYYCQVDKVSPAIGGTLGLGWQAPDPPSVFIVGAWACSGALM